MATRRIAGRVARIKSRRTYRAALRMPKRKLAKMYATKVGQTTYTVVKKRRTRRTSRRKSSRRRTTRRRKRRY